ncbi:MAG: tRNA lysidine(34) synthetase TilS [Planctomycetes bacterium]|nr:tRNA lysidine(34) synthetase TilS [Planctomycetota bacterium]
MRVVTEFRPLQLGEPGGPPPAGSPSAGSPPAGPPPGGRPVVLAVSGGIDSMVLLHLFSRFNQEKSWGLQLHVAHLNHQLRREDSDADAAFVAAEARALRVPCTMESADVAARARSQGVSIELAARQCRYEFLERLCLKLAARVVVLAHHADDNVETVLQRIIRGTGLRGLAGIRDVRPIRQGSDIQLFRPLLAARRSEIEEYAKNQNVPFRVDASNQTAAFARNRVRNELLPTLRERFNPQVDDALTRLCEQARALEAYLRETCTRMLDSIVVEHYDRRVVLHGPSLARRPRVIQTQLIREVILHMGVGEGDVTFGHLNAVADLVASEEGTKEVHLPGGLRVARRYSRLVFELAADQPLTASDEREFCVSASGTTSLPLFGLDLQVEAVAADEAMIAEHLRQRENRPQFCHEEWLDADRVKLPLIARARRPGDRFFPLGMLGMKKLSDFLIDEKIDADQREKVVILCDQLGPVWIVPLRIDQRVRLTRMTRNVLRLVARPASTTTRP